VANLVSHVGCIQSDNNLEIAGVGCLAIKTNYRTHGILGKNNLWFTGCPNIYIDNGTNETRGHDGIHTGKSLFIENGNFTIINCNDGIGIGSSNNGIVRIFKGTFDIDEDSS